MKLNGCQRWKKSNSQISIASPLITQLAILVPSIDYFKNANMIVNLK